jgi:broad specificity phosphatase PhoE
MAKRDRPLADGCPDLAMDRLQAEPMLIRRPDLDRLVVRFPNGESLQDVVARTANALRLVLSRRADVTVVVVAHESANRHRSRPTSGRRGDVICLAARNSPRSSARTPARARRAARSWSDVAST